MNPVGALVRKAEQDYISGTVEKSRYVSESLYDDVSKIEAYLASRHVSGSTDSLGREKPFFNISIAARNIWFRATDIDRKNMIIRHKNPLVALIGKIYLQNWMERSGFGKFLNDWGINSAGYNESVLKFVEQDGELVPMVVPWSRIICDSISFADNPKIEIIELTTAQLTQREGYDKEMVKKLLEARAAREKNDRRKKDDKYEYIKLYEVHGNLPLSYITGKEEDEETFMQQMHVITFLASKERGKYDDYCLYSGKEEKDPYMLTALLPEIDGSIGLNGSVKNLFEAQWMQNHTVKLIKDQLDLASKLIFQTADPNFVGRNVLTEIENGDVLIHGVNLPLSQVSNNSHDITSLQNFQSQWKVLSSEINGISEAMLGQNPPSGTAWRQTQALLNESHSLFEIMTENKGLAIEDMMRKYILPHIKKKLKNQKELVATLEANDIKTIDSIYIKNKATKIVKEKIKEMIKSGEVPTKEEQDAMIAESSNEIKDELSIGGNVRTFKPSEIDSTTWEDIFKDFEWDIKMNITGEASNDNDMVTTLISVLQTIGTNPQALKDPAFALVFNKILGLTGAVNQVELDQVVDKVQNTPSELPSPGGGSMGAMEELVANKQ